MQARGYDIENVKLFKYLGAIVYYKDASTGDAEINQRVDSAEAKYYEHAKTLMNFKILLRTRVQILNTLVRSRLTYGCQVWTLSTVQRNRLHSFYCGLLRKMIRGGFKRKYDSMAFKLTNENILGMRYRIGNSVHRPTTEEVPSTRYPSRRRIANQAADIQRSA